MDISINLPLSKEEIKELARILVCSEQELPNRIKGFATASLREYIQMFLGQKVFNRGSDLREYRLFLLIEEAFGERIPNEQEVSHFFQTTATESKSLIRSVMSKYQYQLKAAIDTSLATIINSSEQDSNGAPYNVVINSQNLVDELNRILAEIDGSLPLVCKRRGSVSTYLIQPSSYARLRERLAQL